MKTIYYLTLILVLVNAEVFAREEASICSCFDCITTELCTLSRNEHTLTKLILNIFLDHGYVSKVETDAYYADVTSYGPGSCLANKAALLTAYWLDLPQPSFVKGCYDTGLCDENMCLGKLKDIENWKLFNNNTCDSNMQTFDISKTSFRDWFQTIKKMFTNYVKNQELDEYIQHAKDIIPKDCPSPRPLHVTDIIKIFFKIINQLNHDCSTGVKKNYYLPPCDQHNVYDHAPSRQESDIDFNSNDHKYYDSTHSKDVSYSPDNTLSKDVSYSPDNTRSKDVDHYQDKTVTVEKLQKLQRFSFIIASYNENENKTCFNKADMEHKKRCHLFADPLFLAKVKLIDSLQRNVLRCNNCSMMNGYKLNKTCGTESLGKYLSSFKIKQIWLEKTFHNLLKCLPIDAGCIEHRKRDTVPEMFHLLAIMTKSSICESGNDQKCRSDLTEEVKIPSLIKYLAVAELITVIPLNKYNPSMDAHSSKNITSILSVMAANQMLDDSKIILDNINILMSLAESTDDKLLRSMLGGLNVKQESRCQSVDELISPGCEQYVVKLQVKLFFHMVSSINNCQEKNVPNNMFGTCKISLADKFHSRCIYDDHNNLKEIGAVNMWKISKIATLIFGKWGDYKDMYDYLKLATKKCAYYAAVLGGKDKIFGKINELEALYKMKTTNPQLFSMGEIGIDLVRKLSKIDKCTDQCPRGYSYCKSTWSCMPVMLPCHTQSMKPVKATMLPKMNANNVTGTPWLVSSIAAGNISIVNKVDDLNHDGGWEFNIDGHWQALRSLPVGYAVKLNRKAKIRYAQNTYHYGLRILYFFYDMSDSNIGQAKKTSHYDKVNIGFMLVHPVVLPLDFTVHTLNQTYELEEDQHHNKGIFLSDLIRVRNNIYRELDPIPKQYADMIPSNEMQLFQESVKRFEASRPVAKVTNQYRHAGWLFLRLKSGRSMSIGDYIPLDFERAELVFRPKMNFHGNLSLNLNVCDCLAEGGPSLSKTTSILIAVHPVNDVPVFRSRSPNLPPLAFNLTDEPNNGFTVRQLVEYTKTTDPEQGLDIGMAVYTLPKSTKYGQWQQLIQGKWQDIQISNPFDPFKTDYRTVSMNESINVLLLKSDDRIRFKLTDSHQLWSYSTARRAFTIGFSYWDGTDGSDKGNVTVPLDYLVESGAFTEPILGVLLRRGCNNKLGSVARYDICGICGGNGKKCIGCDGQKQSGAVIDRCGECTGGTTGLSYNFKIDCGGTCGRYEVGACGICQRKGTASKRDFKDCNGDCFGRARMDKCGVCAGGNTGVTPNRNMDMCKVCFGDNSTCQGCDGTLNSGKKLDACGVCLNPSNPSFDSSCVKVKALYPAVGSSDGGEEILVRGSGFNSEDIVCSFNAARGYTAIYVAGSATISSFKIVTPKMLADKYSFKCSINNNVYELESGIFHVYDSLNFKLKEIIPNQVPINQPVNITVIGQGFADTGTVYCLGMMGKELHQIKGRYIDSQTVICHVPASDESMVVSTALSFSEKRWSANDFRSLSKTTFTIYAPPPLVLSAKLSEDFRKIIVVFDKPAWSSKKKCSSIFSSSTKAALGKRFGCAFKKNKELVISLGSRSTIKVGDNIALLKDSIKSRFQHIITHTPATDVSVQGPVNVIKPIAVLSGPSQVGVCGNVRINGRKSRGAAGRPLIYKWNVEFGDDVDTGSLSTEASNGMASMKSLLAGLRTSTNTLKFSPTDFEFGVVYNFSLSVANFLSVESDRVNLAVTRVHDILPMVKIRGGSRQRIKTRKLNKIQGYARIPKCAEANIEKGLVYAWEVDDPSITLDESSRNKPTLYIYPATLRGGETYKFTLTVSFKSNPAYYTSSDVYLQVMSSPLITKVKGGNRVVSASQPFTLDASLSYDPDKENVQEWFEWECLTSDNLACFVRDLNNTDRYVLYKIPSVPKITVQKGLLESNQTYKFKVTYHKGERSKESTFNIQIKPGNPPAIQVRPQRKVKENVEDYIIVRGRVFAQSAPTRIWVECAKEDDYAFVNLTEPGVLLTPVEVVKRRPGIYPVGMVFNENALDGGLVYKFIAFAENKDGKGVSEIIIRTNAPPSLGIFESNEVNGTALSTDFTLSAVEGWEDDPEDFPLTYSYGYYDDNNQKHYLGAPSSENEKVTKLPTGYSDSYELTLFVEVSDVYKATSTATIVVSVTPPPKIDSKALTDMKASIDEAVSSEDISSTLGAISTTLSTLDQNEKSDSDPSTGVEQNSLGDTMIEFKENITKSVLSMADSVRDRETQDILLKSMGEMTTGGDKFDDQTKLEIASKILSIVKAQTATSSSRKRRSTESSTAEEGGKTPEEVEDIVQTFSNIIAPQAMDNNSMSIKKTFTDLTKDLLVAMCKNIAYDQSAVVAKTDLGNLQAVKNNFENVNTTSIALSCETNCSSPARVVLGQDLQSSFASWSCGSETCSGACIGSVQYTDDLYSTNSNLMTEVVSMKLIDPELYDVLTVGNLKDPVQVQLPLKNENDAKYNFNCQMWDIEFSMWSNASCTSNQKTEIIQGVHNVICHCNRLGVVSVAANGLRDNELEFGNATVNRKVSRIATVTLKFVDDYEATISRVGEASLKTSLQTSIASALNVETWRIRNLSCRNGSIIVTFEYLSNDENIYPNALTVFNQELDFLQTMINAGSLVVTLSDSSTLTLDRHSFKVEVNDVKENRTEESSKTSLLPLYIALGVIGGVLLLACIIFFIIKYKVVSSSYVV